MVGGQDRGEVGVKPSDTLRPQGERAGAPRYVLTMTFAAVDWVMSLDPTGTRRSTA